MKPESSLTIEPAMEKTIYLYEVIANLHLDPRIRWLAFHHRKSRVRRKNLWRIIRWINKEQARRKEITP